MHCGHGIRRWDGIETLYNMVAFDKSAFPFVLQPYRQRFTDMRVIVVGTYVEAYIRQNNDNFRMNLAAGGTSRPHTPDNEQLTFCRDVIRRARFPYAHLDLLVLSFRDRSRRGYHGGPGGSPGVREDEKGVARRNGTDNCRV